MNTQQQKDKFAQFLALYLSELTSDNDDATPKLLDCAFDLFCILDELARNDSETRAKLQNILIKKG